MSRGEDFEIYYNKYLKQEKEFVNIIKKLDDVASEIELRSAQSKNDREIIEDLEKAQDIYDGVRFDFKTAYREKDPSVMYMLGETYSRWNNHYNRLLNKYEMEHTIEFRKKKSSSPKSITKKSNKKPTKKIKRVRK